MTLRFITFFTLFYFVSSLYSGESINRIIATVGHTSITHLDYLKMEEKYDKMEKFLPKNNTKKGKKSPSKNTQIIDMLITRTIVDITAEEETIQVNEKRIESEIERRMEMMNIKEKSEFEKAIEVQSGIPYKLWESELPYQIKKGQLLQIRVSAKMPTEDEIVKWYNQNKAKIGFELRYREIAIVPKDNSIQEEKRVFSEISEIMKEIKKNPSAFPFIASGPRNKSNLRGGLMDYAPVFDIYNNSKIITSLLSRLQNGEISDIFRDEKKRYVIIRMEGKRFTPLEQVRNGIQNILMREKEDKAFMDWIDERKKEISISIYDKQYLVENKLEAPDETFKYNKINP
ncbi:MAG: putative peptidyl-prolyl cis-trans isomerase [Leptospiraceae bacterium]|nr:putative peptidyl-prolyl cis-trans isomerase [Leptospiraceae bacterium]MCP5494038.1 putative peptidyl-prolyl cis-trans isomerase [Leptospiraceae bacterium]